MNKGEYIPIRKEGSESWFILKKFGKRIKFRAHEIKSLKRVRDLDGHGCDESKARGDVKFQPLSWEIL